MNDAEETKALVPALSSLQHRMLVACLEENRELKIVLEDHKEAIHNLIGKIDITMRRVFLLENPDAERVSCDVTRKSLRNDAANAPHDHSTEDYQHCIVQKPSTEAMNEATQKVLTNKAPIAAKPPVVTSFNECNENKQPITREALDKAAAELAADSDRQSQLAEEKRKAFRQEDLNERYQGRNTYGILLSKMEELIKILTP